MRAKTRFALVLCGVLVHVAGCRSAPSASVPDVDRIVGEFRAARDTCREYGSIAKARVKLPRRLQEGRDLYAKAMGAHNGAISRIITAMELGDGALAKKDLEGILGDADSKREDFLAWYDRVVERRRSGQAKDGATAGAGVDTIVSLVGIIVDLVRLQNEDFARQRSVIREELRKCEWPEWDAITVRSQ